MKNTTWKLEEVQTVCAKAAEIKSGGFRGSQVKLFTKAQRVLPPSLRKRSISACLACELHKRIVPRGGVSPTWDLQKLRRIHQVIGELLTLHTQFKSVCAKLAA